MLVGAVATGLFPIPVMLGLLFCSGLVTFPAWAARSATLPAVLSGDAYTLAIAINTAVYQIAQIAGFAAGGVLISIFSPLGVLAIDAGTFVASAALLWRGIKQRPAPVGVAQRKTLTGDTIAAIKLLATDQVLRRILLVVWASCFFAYAHEGIAAAFAASLGQGPTTTGLLLAASPFGTLLASLIFIRVLSPPTRLQAVPLCAIIACAALIPVGFDIPLWAILSCYVLNGAGMILMVPLNAAFNQVLPPEFRGRAAGIAITGLTVCQAVTFITAGLLADHFLPRHVVAGAGILGLLLLLVLVARWPSPSRLTTPITVKPQ